MKNSTKLIITDLLVLEELTDLQTEKIKGGAEIQEFNAALESYNYHTDAFIASYGGTDAFIASYGGIDAFIARYGYEVYGTMVGESGTGPKGPGSHHTGSDD